LARNRAAAPISRSAIVANAHDGGTGVDDGGTAAGSPLTRTKIWLGGLKPPKFEAGGNGAIVLVTLDPTSLTPVPVVTTTLPEVPAWADREGELGGVVFAAATSTT
jgi:hypothetical protein